MREAVSIILFFFGGLAYFAGALMGACLAGEHQADWWTYKFTTLRWGVLISSFFFAGAWLVYPKAQRMLACGIALWIYAGITATSILTFFSIFGTDDVRKLDPKYSGDVADYAYAVCVTALPAALGLIACRGAGSSAQN